MRIDVPEKNWKFGLADIGERRQWEHYLKVYEACLSATSTVAAPWYIVPADDKKNAWLMIFQVVLDTLKQLRMNYSEADKAHRNELRSIRKLLAK